VIPASFDYEVAESIDDALRLLGSDPDAKLIAGGHSLVPALKLRIARPSKLVDIGRLSDLAYVREAGDQLAIGALTRHKAVRDDPLLREHCPIVSTTAGMIGDPQVRHRGTIGGSLAHGDPASDLPAVMLALGAELVVRGRVQAAADDANERVIPAASFFTGVFETALQPGEMLVEIRVPKLVDWTGWSYLKFRRRAQDWATVGVAALVRREDGGAVAASVALTNMGGTPLRARAVEDAITGGASPADAAAHAADGTTPSSDTAASAAFRAHLARVLAGRALDEALSR
jgi:carbon-monoxide dehydrogenase medium subunit